MTHPSNSTHSFTTFSLLSLPCHYPVPHALKKTPSACPNVSEDTRRSKLAQQQMTHFVLASSYTLIYQANKPQPRNTKMAPRKSSLPPPPPPRLQKQAGITVPHGTVDLHGKFQRSGKLHATSSKKENRKNS